MKNEKNKISEELEKKYSEKWKINYHSDEDLKKVAKELYNGDIYTDRHCDQTSVNITSVFMPLLFMKHSEQPSDKSGNRDNLIYKLLEEEIENKHYNNYIKNIGMIYEYLSQKGPMAINGQPIFMSFRYLNKSDTEKMFRYYDEYKKLRKVVDNF